MRSISLSTPRQGRRGLYVAVVIAALAVLVVSAGGLYLTMNSAAERTREIGLRKAVGARARDILLQFLVEALAISLIGLAMGSIAPLAVTLLGLFDAPVALGAILTAVGFACAVGLFSGIYPAARAARLSTITALRLEAEQ